MARARTSMREIREMARLRHECGLTQREVARSSKVGLGTVNKVLRGLARAGLEWPLPEDIGEERLQELVYGVPAEVAGKDIERREQLEFSEVHKELQRRRRLTIRLLWEEYRGQHGDGYSYSQFCKLYREWKGQRDVSMVQLHKAGEKLFVDYAGSTVTVHEPNGPFEAQIFVAVLGASSYFFTEASRGQDLQSWIGSHERALQFFGGVPQICVPDNLRSAVTRAHLYEPRLNRSYKEMARHYGMAVVPARVRKPKDKAKAEKCVQIVSGSILERLRHERFESLADLNQSIGKLRDEINRKPFQKRPESRLELFEQLDKPALGELPAEPYKLAIWKRARVNIDYHVAVEGHYYSAPVGLVQQVVDVRISEHGVELLHKGARVALHARSHRKGHYTTCARHRPKAHREQAKWTPQRLQQWAAKVGPSTAGLIGELLEGRQHPQEHFRACLGILRLSERHGADRMEAAAKRALHYGQASYRGVQRILAKNADRLPLDEECREAGRGPLEHGNVRGGEYYREAGSPGGEGGEGC